MIFAIRTLDTQVLQGVLPDIFPHTSVQAFVASEFLDVLHKAVKI